MACVMGGQGRSGGASVGHSQSRRSSNAQQNWQYCRMNGMAARPNTLTNILHVPASSALALGNNFLLFYKTKPAHVQYIPTQRLTVSPSNNTDSLHSDNMMHLLDATPLCSSHRLETTLSPSLRLRLMIYRLLCSTWSSAHPRPALPPVPCFRENVPKPAEPPLKTCARFGTTDTATHSFFSLRDVAPGHPPTMLASLLQLPFCGAETPDHPCTPPHSYLQVGHLLVSHDIRQQKH